MSNREAVESVVGLLIVDKYTTYVSGLIVEDLLERGDKLEGLERLWMLEAVLNLMHRTDPRYKELKSEERALKKKVSSKLARDKDKVIKEKTRIT